MPSIRGYVKYKGLCQVEVKLKFRICFVHVRSNAKVVFGSSCYNCIGTSCYSRNIARSARTDGSASDLCAVND